MAVARRTGDIAVPPLQMARTILSWRVHVGAATGDGEMHDPPMQLARSAELEGHAYPIGETASVFRVPVFQARVQCCSV